MQFISRLSLDDPKHRVFIGIGAGDGTVEVPCVLSLFGSSPLLRAAGIEATLCIEAGNCHVDDMRNSIVTSFLASDAEQLIFIDEDVGFRPEDLVKLVLYDRDVVGGVYPKKEDVENFPVYVEGGTELWADEDGLVEVHGLPTGFLKFRREVVQILWDSHARKRWIGSDGREYRQIFERVIEYPLKWSHDYAVCRKWAKMGGKLYTDPYMEFTHTGRKTWAGNLAEYWLRQHGLAGKAQAERLVHEVARLKAGEPDFDALHKAWGNADWTASAALCEALWDNCAGRVLECGSGLSTIILAAAGCEVTVLEHDPHYASHTAGMLDQFGLKADIVCKPLVRGWYDFPGGEYDCLVIDGPPRDISDRALALDRVNAPLVVWDDYAGGLDEPEINDSGKPFAIWREKVKA